MKEKKTYRRFAKKSDPKKMIAFPKEIFEDVICHAERNGRTLAEEVIARVAVTLENQAIMSEDRWMRLIFCKKLAHKGK